MQRSLYENKILCKENKLPLIVLDINAPRAVLKAVKGDKVGTLVS